MYVSVIGIVVYRYKDKNKMKRFYPSVYSSARVRPYKRAKSARAVANEHAKMRGRLAALKPELKFFDTALTETQFATTAAVSFPSLNLIPQGVTESTRVGRKCTIKKLHLNFRLTKDASATLAGTDTVRVIVYVDKQANGAAATAADILEVTTDTFSYRNLANVNRFRILKDIKYQLNAQAAAGDGTTNSSVVYGKYYQCSVPLDLPIEFDSTTGAITEIKSNNIGILMIDENAGSDLKGRARVRFYDG